VNYRFGGGAVSILMFKTNLAIALKKAGDLQAAIEIGET
jgi:hypothetical protein